MKTKLLVTLPALLLTAEALALAASQEWVQNYVSNYVANSTAELQINGSVYRTNNNATVYSVGEGTNRVVLILEDYTDAALQVTNATTAALADGVTNKTLFVWDGDHSYLNPLGTITATKTNMVYNGVGSTYSEETNLLTFKGYFDARPVAIQHSVSLSVTNSLTNEVSP